MEGYWISENGESLAFTDETEVVIDNDFIGEYKIYDDNKLLIKYNTFVTEVPFSAEFTVADETLTLRDLDTQAIYIYYTEQKLAEIREMRDKNLRTILEKIQQKYEDLYPNCSINGIMDGVFIIDDKECPVYRFYSDQQTHTSTLDFFAIDPDSQTIYIQDYLSGEYVLWNDNL